MAIRHNVSRAKYNSRPKVVDGIRFDSKKEADYYSKLKYAQKAGDVVMFLRQVPFDLPGGIKYRIDFVEFWADGTTRFIDVKGFATQKYKLKKRQVEALYPITITEV